MISWKNQYRRLILGVALAVGGLFVFSSSALSYTPPVLFEPSLRVDGGSRNSGGGGPPPPPPPVYYTVTITKNVIAPAAGYVYGGGMNCGTVCSVVLPAGSYVNLATTATAGYFTGWSGDCTGTGNCGLYVNGNKNVTATFEPSYPLTVTKSGNGTVTSNPAGINCGATCTASFVPKSNVTLSAVPDTGYLFKQWGGACSGSGTCIVTMNGTQNVTATFMPYRTLMTTVAGSGTVTSAPAGISCNPTCSAVYEINTPVTLTPAPAPDFVFTGWSGACSGTGNCTVTMSQDRSVGAAFTPLRRLTVIRQGGGYVSSPQGGIDCGATCTAQYVNGTNVTLTPANTPGVFFNHWSGACNGSAGCAVAMNTDATVYAVYDTTLSVTATAGGTLSSAPVGIDCGSTCSAVYNYGTSVTITPVPQSGYAFSGWSGDCSGTGGCTVTMGAPKTVAASFTPTHALTLAIVGGGSVSSTPAGITCGPTCSATFMEGTNVTLTPTPAAGYVFGRWTGACTGSGGCTVTVNGNTSVGAEFDPVISLSVSGQGHVTSTPVGLDCTTACTAAFPLNASVVLTATGTNGYQFDHWTGDCSGTTCTLAMSGPKNVTAVFYPLIFVTKNIAGAGRVYTAGGEIDCGPTCMVAVAPGTHLFVFAEPDVNYVFAGWFGGCTGTSFCSITINAPTLINANFSPATTLSVTKNGSGSVSSSPGGIDCGLYCGAKFAQGSSVTITATPDYGYGFDHWSGDCTGTSPSCTLTMSVDRNATATFRLLPTHTLTVNVGDHGQVNGTNFPSPCVGPATCTYTYPEGTAVSLSAAPVAGFGLTAWSGGCSGFAACPLTVNGDVTVGASFGTLRTVNVTKVGGPDSGVLSSTPSYFYCGTGLPACTYAILSIPDGRSLTIHAAPAAGYAFTGWTDACSGTGDCTLTISGNTAATANFVTGKLLTFNGFSAGTSGRVVSTPAGLDCTGPCSAYFPVYSSVSITAYANPGFSFNSFGIVGCNTSNPCNLYMDDNLQFTVILNTEPPRTLGVTVGGSGSGHVTSSPAGIDCQYLSCYAQFTYNSTVTLTATPGTDSYFDGWSGACTGYGPCTVTMDNSKSVQANFYLKPMLTVYNTTGSGTVTSTPAGINCPVSNFSCSAQFDHSAVVTLHAQPDSGYQFLGWDVASDCAAAGTGDCTLTMDQNHTAQAYFELLPRLVLNVHGPGSVTNDNPGGACVSTTDQTCVYSYSPTATLVTLTAVPDAGNKFFWDQACAGTSTTTCQVTTNAVTGDVTVDMYFFPPGLTPTIAPPDATQLPPVLVPKAG